LKFGREVRTIGLQAGFDRERLTFRAMFSTAMYNFKLPILMFDIIDSG